VELIDRLTIPLFSAFLVAAGAYKWVLLAKQMVWTK